MTAPAIDLEAAAAVLSASPDFRVLRKLVPLARYNDEPWNLGDRSRVKVALMVDVETTGTDTARDEIVEFAAVPFTYDAVSGTIYEVLAGYHGFREPSVPVSDGARAKHHISDEMLKGQSLDAERIAELVGGAAITIAYHSDFDRRMTERALPVFASAAWGCACWDVDWEAFGVVGRKLENVLLHACGTFFEAHRAMDDVLATIHALATASLDDRPAMSYLLDAARTPTTRVWAARAPYEMKDELRERGYRWAANRKTWYRDVRGERGSAPVSAELAWLDDRRVRPDITTLSAKERFSVRSDL